MEPECGKVLRAARVFCGVLWNQCVSEKVLGAARVFHGVPWNQRVCGKVLGAATAFCGVPWNRRVGKCWEQPELARAWEILAVEVLNQGCRVLPGLP